MALVFGEGGGGVGSSFKPAGATLSGLIKKVAGAVSGAGAAAQAAVQAAGTKAQQVGVSGTPVEGSPNLLWVDTPSGGYYYDKSTGYRWQNGAWYSPQGYQWVDDGAGGHFRDPSSGLIWKDGLWVDPAKQQVFIGGQWQSPQVLGQLAAEDVLMQNQLQGAITAERNFNRERIEQAMRVAAAVRNPLAAPLILGQQPPQPGPNTAANFIANPADWKRYEDQQIAIAGSPIRPSTVTAQNFAANPSDWKRWEDIQMGLAPAVEQRRLQEMPQPGAATASNFIANPADWKRYEDVQLGTAGNIRFQQPDPEEWRKNPAYRSWWEDQQNRERVRNIDEYIQQKYGSRSTADFLKGIYNATNTYFFDPIAETGAQLTPALLNAAANLLPGGYRTGELAKLVTKEMAGYDVDAKAKSGISDLVESVKESGGNPKEFAEIQHAKYLERPLWQQIAAGVVYDPTNLIGAGLFGQADEAADVARAGTRLSEILRGADTAADAVQRTIGREVVGAVGGYALNEAAGGKERTGIEPWQAALLGAGVGNMTRRMGSVPGMLGAAAGQAASESLRALPARVPGSGTIARLASGEAGEASARLGARLAIGAAGGMAGAMAAPEDASLEERLAWILSGAAVGAGGLDLVRAMTDNLARAAGKTLEHRVTRPIVPGLVGAGIGLAAAPDDATTEEKLKWALGGAAIGGGIGLATPPMKGFTSPLARKTYADWLTEAADVPAVKAFRERAAELGLSVEDVPLFLKELSNVDRPLPLTARVADAWWAFLSKFIDAAQARRIDNRVYWIAEAFRQNNDIIRRLVPVWANIAGADDIARNFEVDELGRVLIDEDTAARAFPDPDIRIQYAVPDRPGKYIVPVIKQTEDALEMHTIGATLSDVAARAKTYKELGLLTDEQFKALERADRALRPLYEMALSMGLEPDELATGDFYFPRGEPVPVERVDAYVEPQGIRRSRTVSGLEGRKWPTAGEAIATAGVKYPNPDQVLVSHVQSMLDEINLKYLSDQLDKVVIDEKTGAKLGDLRVQKGVRQALDDLNAEARKIESQARRVKAQSARIQRDIRIEMREMSSLGTKIDRLVAQANLSDESLAVRLNAAKTAHDLAKQEFDDALSSISEYARKTQGVAGQASAARQELNSLIREAKMLQREAKRVKVGEGNLHDFVNRAMNYRAKVASIKRALATDMAELHVQIESLADVPGRGKAAGQSDVLKPVAKDLAAQYEAAAAELERMGKQFKGVDRQVKSALRTIEKTAKEEGRLTQAVKDAVARRRAGDLQRLVDARSKRLASLLEADEKASQKIAELGQQLAENRAIADVLKKDISETEQLAAGYRRRWSSTLSDAGLNVKGWDQVPVPPEIVNQLAKVMRKPSRFSPIWDIFDLVNNSFRFIGASLDMAYSMTAGVFGLYDNPNITRASFADALKAATGLKSEWQILREIEDDAVKRGLPSIAELVGKGGLEVAPSEVLLRALGDEDSLSRRLAQLPPFRQAEVMFTMQGNSDRLRRAYALLEEAQKRGVDISDPDVLKRISNAANLLGGRARTGAISAFTTEKAMSRTFFAARFVESQIETVMNALLSGGVEGDVARRALLRLGVGGGLLTFGLNEFMGQPTEWDPIKDGRWNPNWMKVRIYGHDVSLFGSFDSFMRGVMSSALKNPSEFIRPRLAPLPGLLADLPSIYFRGETMTGYPVKKGDWLGYAPIPFTVRDVIDRAREGKGSPGEIAFGTGLSFLGIKASPLTAREKLNEAMNNAYEKYEFAPKGLDGQPLNYDRPDDPLSDPLFVLFFEKQNPELIPESSSKVAKEIKETRAEYQKRLEAVAKRAESGEITLGEWKEQRKIILAEQRGALAKLVEQLPEPRAVQPGTPAEWVRAYYQTFEEAEDPETGLLDYERLDALQSQWRAKYGPEAQRYIDALMYEKALPGIEQEYRRVVNQLTRDGYFPGLDNSISRLAVKMSDLPDKTLMDLRSEALDAMKRPEWAALEKAPLKDRLILYFTQKGYPVEVAIDVYNLGVEKMQNPDFVIYKKLHPDLLTWLDDNATYDTVKALNQQYRSY